MFRLQVSAGFSSPWLLGYLVLAVWLGGPATTWSQTIPKGPTEEQPRSAQNGKVAEVTILTTPEGADLPEGVELLDFPLLIRLHQETFDFAAAQPAGADLRIQAENGDVLPHQIDSWDAAAGEAAIWVRVPVIRGNAKQRLKLLWGSGSGADPAAVPGTAGEIDRGASVFTRSHGYLSVWHLGEDLRDQVGTLETKDMGTQPIQAVIGAGRHLAGGQGLFGGEAIPDYPSGAEPHCTSAWFRPERSNVTIVAWGNEGGGRGTKVRMQIRSPPHLHVDSFFEDVSGSEPVLLGEWQHVAYSHEAGVGRLYLNGRLVGEGRPNLAIKSPGRLWLGGWYNHYDFVGGLDEVRIARVPRSSDWIKLEYENQKPLQTAVGILIQPGRELKLSADKLEVPEGGQVTVSAQAGGAEKLYWVLVESGRETIVAVDRLSYTYRAPRVLGPHEARLEMRAVYPEGVRTQQVDLLVRDTLPEPEVRLTGPGSWDGRTSLELQPEILNRATLQTAGVGECQVDWSLQGPAVIRQAAADRLLLSRAQGSGKLTITCRVSNGGAPVSQTCEIDVQEPAGKEPWLEREPADEERPADGQFYARHPETNQGKVYYSGRLDQPAERVFARLFDSDSEVAAVEARPDAAGRYQLSLPIAAGLKRYRCEFGVLRGEQREVLHRADDLVCGDAFLIIGQSNAVATDFGEVDPPPPNPWIRTFGAMDGSPAGSRLELWGSAVARAPGGKLQIGYWGMELGRRLVESQQVPICLINGAVGGTRIDQHQRDEAEPTSASTIYGRLLWRVRAAGLSHGIRGIIWHQGENDQGADGPSGAYGWETYRQYFIDLAAAWKRDYPNVENYYLFQIWPKACAMGRDGSDDRLREVQRTLPRHYSKLHVLSTLGIRPPGGCHYPAAGYAEFARLLAPLIETKTYGRASAVPVTSPNLIRASWADPERSSLWLEFDQPVRWDDSLCDQFFLNDQTPVAAGQTLGNRLLLKLPKPAVAETITYLDSDRWTQDKLLWGANDLAALTFCEVAIEPPPQP